MLTTEEKNRLPVMGGTRLYFEYKEQNKVGKLIFQPERNFKKKIQYSVTCNRKKAPTKKKHFHVLVYKLVTYTCSKNFI